MLDFICMIFAELSSTGYKRKIQNDILNKYCKSFIHMSPTAPIAEWLEDTLVSEGSLVRFPAVA